MKNVGRILFPALFLFVLGCGGGGQTTTGGTAGGGGEPALPAGYGLIKIDIHQESTGAPIVGPRTLAPNGSLPAADNVRIAARLVKTQTVEILDDNGFPMVPPEFVEITSEVFRKIIDVGLPPPGPVSIAVPAADGYTVEVLSSASGGIDSIGNPIRIMLKYGKISGLSVIAGASTPATITANPIASGLKITPPDNVIAGSKYFVPVTIDNVPLSKSFYFQQFVDNSLNSPPSGIFVDNKSTLFFTPAFTAQSLTTAPGQGFWDLYFQGLFFIDGSWQSDTDKFNFWKQWIFYYPNPNAGYADPLLKTKLYPLGTVTIIVNLSPSR